MENRKDSGFVGSHNSGPFSVVRIEPRATRDLVPPVGGQFRWGDMSESTGTLAVAIATALYPADMLLPDGYLPKAADLIKRHFLTTFHKHRDWELDDNTILAYLATRLPDPTAAPVPA